LKKKLQKKGDVNDGAGPKLEGGLRRLLQHESKPDDGKNCQVRRENEGTGKSKASLEEVTRTWERDGLKKLT